MNRLTVLRKEHDSVSLRTRADHWNNNIHKQRSPGLLPVSSHPAQCVAPCCRILMYIMPKHGPHVLGRLYLSFGWNSDAASGWM